MNIKTQLFFEKNLIILIEIYIVVTFRTNQMVLLSQTTFYNTNDDFNVTICENDALTIAVQRA